MKNKKGFTLVELLAVIVILAVIILIAVNAVLPQMRKARKNSFVDEAINFAKAAETAYVSDSLSGAGRSCYNVKDLKGQYVAKNDEDYDGWITITVNAQTEDITKRIWITDGKNFYVSNADPSKSDMSVSNYSSSAWEALDEAKDAACACQSCEEEEEPANNNGQ